MINEIKELDQVVTKVSFCSWSLNVHWKGGFNFDKQSVHCFFFYISHYYIEPKLVEIRVLKHHFYTSFRWRHVVKCILCYCPVNTDTCIHITESDVSQINNLLFFSFHAILSYSVLFERMPVSDTLNWLYDPRMGLDHLLKNTTPQQPSISLLLLLQPFKLKYSWLAGL